MRAAAVALACFVAWPAAAQIAVDGDTIKIISTLVRLHGIDAAESAQVCSDGWPAGRRAADYLAELMRGRAITCEPKTVDRYGRVVALCRADGRDLGADMVRAGMALAFVRYSADYVEFEAEAKAARLGVHGHDCISAWEYRAQQRR